MKELEQVIQGMSAQQLRRTLMELVQVLGPEKELRTVLDLIDVVKAEEPKYKRRTR